MPETIQTSDVRKHGDLFDVSGRSFREKVTRSPLRATPEEILVAAGIMNEKGGLTEEWGQHDPQAQQDLLSAAKELVILSAAERAGVDMGGRITQVFERRKEEGPKNILFTFSDRIGEVLQEMGKTAHTQSWARAGGS